MSTLHTQQSMVVTAPVQMVDARKPILHYWGLSHPASHFNLLNTLNLTHHLVWNLNNRSWKLTLKSELPASHPSVTHLFQWGAIESPASRRKMRVLPEAVLAHSKPPLLYDKLAISNTYSHAKNYKHPCSITWPKVILPEVGFSAVAILGGGWLHASDGPPWGILFQIELHFWGALKSTK